MSSPLRRVVPIEITSRANARVKELVQLRKRRSRRNSGVTLVEGYEELDLALRAGVRPKDLFFCPELHAEGDPLGVLDRCAGAGASLFRLSRAAFEQAAYRESPDGWLAVTPPIETELNAITVDDGSLFVVCASVEKPGNLGSMLRTADAAGVTAVISADPVTDWGNPNVIRASKGTVFAVPVASCSSDELREWLRGNDIAVIATTPDTDVLMTDVDLTGRVAIFVGSEKHGLSEEWLRDAHHRVKIPMYGRVDSLNVAVSAAIVMYEAVRQRRS
jgi:RNA methyltransferase, TrmH family